MEKKIVVIGGYPVTQISETEYELANEKETLDFFIDAADPEEVDVLVFDSLRPTKGKDNPFLTVFSASTLEEAITDAMKLTKADVVNFATDWN